MNSTRLSSLGFSLIWKSGTYRSTEKVLHCHLFVKEVEDVQTKDLRDSTFEAEVFLSASPTFYAWVFTFGRDIQITAPETIREQYQQMLQNCLETGK